jgi:AAA+ ATPase superfamily predicted ATPase
MPVKFIGREKEKSILKDALTSYEAEMVAVIGRRRVGKTFLIKHTYAERLVFSVTGLQNAPIKEQLENFAYQIKEASGSSLPLKTPENWLQAFILLIDYLKTLDFSERKVVFLDELSWMSTHRSGFLRALGFFWNSWAVDKNIVVVICGSAASWMIQKVVNHRGGLHNRITKRIFLQPFNLAETKTYFQSKHFNFNHYQISQIYLAMGGIPHYLKEVKGNKSAVQNINDICFSESGLLRDEFSRLYVALFENADRHIAVIRALATSNQGLSKKALIEKSKLPNGGGAKTVLEELEQSGFIKVFYPFGKKKKGALYRLTDEYSLFYLRFIEGKIYNGEDSWTQLSQTQTYKTWSGYAFESLCLKHISQIKKALSIGGVYSIPSTFLKQGKAQEKGTQIDLLLDRNDQVINIFEIKYNNKEVSISKEYASKLRQKLWVFEETTKTKKQLFLTMITTFGLKHNQHSLGLVQEVLVLDDLFLEV